MAKKNYALSTDSSKQIAAPTLPYEPRDPKRYRPNIALIGCGGITATHLTAYKRAGYRVVALCDVDRSRAEQRRKDFYPNAKVYDDPREVLRREDIEVVDVATHPRERFKLVEQALRASKHVLSQKPFVLDLDQGEKLVDLTDKQNVKLAVNQNGRWAPHFSYMRHAISHGILGDMLSAHLSVHWNHDWCAGTPFDNVRHLILYDFAIHWFDITRCLLPRHEPKRVFATLARAKGQKSKPPLLGQVLIEFDNAQASLAFDGFARFGACDRTYVSGIKGSMQSIGPNLDQQAVTLYTARGQATPKLRGKWFPDGFHGTMGELLLSIEQKREPFNSARDNLKSLALCFAAMKSADTGKPVKVGSVRRAS